MNNHLRFFADSSDHISSRILAICFLCASAASSFTSSILVSGRGPPSICVVTTSIDEAIILAFVTPSIPDAETPNESGQPIILGSFTLGSLGVGVVASISSFECTFCHGDA